MIEDRPLGHSGLSTVPLVLGGNVFGWTADEQTSFDILDAFVAGGGTMIDSADVYSAFAPGLKGGESETVIGRWLKARGRRDDVQITTKVGITMDGSPGGLRPERIMTIVEESLTRLQTDYIDLYYAHKDDPDTPLESVLEAFDRLVQSGKVRAIAASNYSAERLGQALDISRAHKWPAFCALQPHYNLLEREEFEGALQQFCIDNQLGVLPYFGLAGGFLTGKYRNKADVEGKPRAWLVDKYLNPRGQAVLAALDTIADETGALHAQIALAWLAAQPGITAPIASATTLAQMEILMRSLMLELTPEHLALLDKASRS